MGSHVKYFRVEVPDGIEIFVSNHKRIKWEEIPDPTKTILFTVLLEQ